MRDENSSWVDDIKELDEKKHIKLFDIGGGLVSHNLMCWICNKNPAVYSMNPEWVFRPCWECQGKLRIKK